MSVKCSCKTDGYQVEHFWGFGNYNLVYGIDVSACCSESRILEVSVCVCVIDQLKFIFTFECNTTTTAANIPSTTSTNINNNNNNNSGNGSGPSSSSSSSSSGGGGSGKHSNSPSANALPVYFSDTAAPEILLDYSHIHSRNIQNPRAHNSLFVIYEMPRNATTVVDSFKVSVNE